VHIQPWLGAGGSHCIELVGGDGDCKKRVLLLFFSSIGNNVLLGCHNSLTPMGTYMHPTF